MNPTDHSKVHGSVRSLRVELAEWDLSNGQWQAPRQLTLTQFLPDGSVSEPEPQDPPRYIYDETGRKTKVQAVPKSEGAGAMMIGIEGTEQAYGAEGVTEIRTHYDDRGQPSEALFYDSNGDSVLCVMFGRDAAGRLVLEESKGGDKSPYEQTLANMPAEQREATAAAFSQLFGPQNLMFRTTYRYDDQGRRVERNTLVAGLGEQRTTWYYDEHDNPTREVQEDLVRDMDLDESGGLQPKEEKSLKSECQFDYKYDAKGNWTERVVSTLHDGLPGLQPSNILRREITYWPGS
jgi:hypothetical protein